MSSHINKNEQFVVVLGASNKPQRYSYMALMLLREKGYPVIPVHPKLENVEGIPVVHKLECIQRPVHTLTLYVGEERSDKLQDAIIQLKPERVIFNPGSESGSLEQRLIAENIEVVHGCTLVMLKTGTF